MNTTQIECQKCFKVSRVNISRVQAEFIYECDACYTSTFQNFLNILKKSN